MSRAATGRHGEELAARYLERHGYRIVERRFRVRGGEIDLVADGGDVLAFVEVKTRRQGALDDGRGAVDARKRRRIATAAGLFLATRGQQSRCRFDVITVELDGEGRGRITHIPGAFDA